MLLDADDDCAVFLAGEGADAPESVRGAKERLAALTGRPYRETVHQAKLSAVLDVERARECRWFRKFEKELLAILRG